MEHTAETYREAALEHLKSARMLHDDGRRYPTSTTPSAGRRCRRRIPTSSRVSLLTSWRLYVRIDELSRLSWTRLDP